MPSSHPSLGVCSFFFRVSALATRLCLLLSPSAGTILRSTVDHAWPVRSGAKQGMKKQAILFAASASAGATNNRRVAPLRAIDCHQPTREHSWQPHPPHSRPSSPISIAARRSRRGTRSSPTTAASTRCRCAGWTAHRSASTPPPRLSVCLSVGGDAAAVDGAQGGHGLCSRADG